MRRPVILAALVVGSLSVGQHARAGDPPPDAETLPLPPVPPRIAEGADYEKCLDMLATDPAGADAFADAWEATGGGEAAQHCLGLAKIELGDPDAGAALLDGLAAASAAPAVFRAEIYGQADQAWLMAGKPDSAYASATLAVTLSPDDPELRIGRSIAAATLQHYDQAIEDLDVALELDPKRSEALVFRAAAFRNLGRLDEAEADIDRATALDADNPDVLLERGIIRQRRGDLAGARADWDRVLDLDPDTATGDLAQQNLALLEAGPPP